MTDRTAYPRARCEGRPMAIPTGRLCGSQAARTRLGRAVRWVTGVSWKSRMQCEAAGWRLGSLIRVVVGPSESFRGQ